jgi:HemY protein
VKLLATLVLALLIGLTAIWFMPVLQGYVLIRTGGVAVEMSVFVLVASVLAAVLLLHLAVWLWNMPGNALRGYLDRRAQAQLELGMLALSEGDWSRAEKALRLSASKSANPAAQYLAAARAASKTGKGDPDRVEVYLEKANESARAQHPIAVTRAQLLLAAGDPAQALKVLKEIRRPREDRPKVLELLARCFERLEMFDDLSELVPALIKHKLIDEVHGQRIQRSALQRRMDQAPDMGALQGLWSALPKATRRQNDVLAGFAGNAVKLGQGSAVEKELRLALNRRWSDQLVMLYGQGLGEDASARLKQAEKWLLQHPDNAVLNLTLARLCVACKLWGKAREYFDLSLGLQPMAESYQELGDLMARDGENDAALANYRKALELLKGSQSGQLIESQPAQFKGADKP